MDATIPVESSVAEAMDFLAAPQSWASIIPDKTTVGTIVWDNDEHTQFTVDNICISDIEAAGNTLTYNVTTSGPVAVTFSVAYTFRQLGVRETAGCHIRRRVFDYKQKDPLIDFKPTILQILQKENANMEHLLRRRIRNKL